MKNLKDTVNLFTARNFTNEMDVVVHVYNRYLEKTVQTINVTKIIVKPV